MSFNIKLVQKPSSALNQYISSHKRSKKNLIRSFKNQMQSMNIGAYDMLEFVNFLKYFTISFKMKLKT